MRRAWGAHIDALVFRVVLSPHGAPCVCQVFACCWKRGRCNRLLLEGADLTVQVSYRHRSMFERPASFHHIANHRVSFSLDDIFDMLLVSSQSLSPLC